MRSFLAAIATAAAITTATLTASPAADELLALEGEQLLVAAEKIAAGAEEKFSTEELVALSAKLASANAQRSQEQLTKEQPRRSVFRRYFETACAKATGAELAKLIEIYVALDPLGPDKQRLLQPLATAWAMNDLATRADLSGVELPPLDRAISPELADAPQELVAAWQLYKRATQRFDASLRRGIREPQAVSFQMNRRAFYRVIDDVLQRRGEGLAEQLAAFAWSGWCRTGSDSLDEPREIGMFLALLHEGRIPEAIGAALRLESEAPLVSADRQQNARVEFLKRCGLDWEALLAGAQVDGEVLLSVAGWRAVALQELAEFGSDRGVMLMLQMARRAPQNRHSRYAAALSGVMLHGTKNTSRGARYWSWLGRRAGMPISPETKTHVVAALQEMAATPDAPPAVAESAVVALAHAKAPETKATLHALLKHPSPEVTEVAAEALRSLGETIAPVAPIEPVRFRLSFNGAVVPAGRKIRWGIRFGKMGGVSSGDITDAAGNIALERKYFIDRTRAATAVVFTGGSGNDPVDRPAFEVELAVPQNLDAVIPVDIPVTRVELHTQRAHSLAGDSAGTARVTIERQFRPADLAAPRPFERLPWEFDVALSQPVTLAIQAGTYKLKVSSPGAENYIGPLFVGADPTPVNIALKPGGDVRFSIVRPDGEEEARCRLLQAGTELGVDYFNHQTKSYEGLPVGDYILRIPSSAEAYASRDRAPLVAYHGRDIPFTITGDSVEPLDLGEIRLGPARN